MTTFGDDLAAGMVELRELALSSMRDAVRVERVDGVTLGPDLEQVPNWVVVYEGPCKLVPTDFKDSQASAGESSFDVADAKITAPVTEVTGLIRNGDRATITETAYDPANVGRVFTLQRDPDRTYPIERRFSCQEVS